MDDFQALNLQAPLLRALKKLEFKSPTKVQSQAIPPIASGKDVMVSSRTGSGKTAAFLLPMLNQFLNESKPQSATRGLILLPTRELALQTQKTFEQLAAFTYVKCGLLMGGEALKYQVSTIRKNPEVLIATPGRLVEHIEKGHIDFSDLEVLVLDEADRMLDMGFSDAMETISGACNTERQNLLFSATLTHKGLHRISENLLHPVKIEIDSRTRGHGNIVEQRILVDDDRHKENVIVKLIEEEDAQRVFVFCKTRLQCQKVSNILRSNKLVSEYIHGEVSQSDRKQVMYRFRDGKIRVLVATDVAARGLDIKDVDIVVNFTVAFSGDDHVHRVGRTGRSGAEGLAVTLVNELDWNLMSSIERYLKIRLIPRKIKGLEAKYSGPKKVKSSGKAAGTKKKKDKNTKASTPKKSNKKVRPASAKNTKKKPTPIVKNGGHGLLKRKKNTDLGD